VVFWWWVTPITDRTFYDVLSGGGRHPKLTALFLFYIVVPVINSVAFLPFYKVVVSAGEVVFLLLQTIAMQLPGIVFLFL